MRLGARSLGRLLALAVLPFVLGCHPERTTIRVALTTSESSPLVLDSINVESENGGARSPVQTVTPGHDLTLQAGKSESFVLLFDNQRKGPITIVVDGFLDGVRVAHGDAAATLVPGKNVDVTIPLAKADPLPSVDLSTIVDLGASDSGGGTD